MIGKYNIGKINFFLNKNFLKYAQLLKKITAVTVVVLTTASRLSKNMRLWLFDPSLARTLPKIQPGELVRVRIDQEKK